MLKIGLIGCGVVADYGHLPAIREIPEFQLTALFDPDEARVKSVAAKFEAPHAFTNQEEFFNSGLDAVVVASPAPAHKTNVLAAAQHGVHVLCEKPLAATDEDAAEMIEAMEKANRFLFTGFVYRFSPVALQIQQWVRDGIVGDIRALRLIYLWDLHGRYEQKPDGTWIESPRWIGRMKEGGPMVDCGVHQIDLARWWLADEVVGSTGVGAWLTDDYEAPDHVWLHLDHAKGAKTMVEMSFSYGHTVREPAPVFTYELIGTGGVLKYDRNGWRVEARNGGGVVVAPGASEKNFLGMYQEFARALRTGEPGNMPSGRDGLVATQLATDATEAIIANRRR